MNTNIELHDSVVANIATLEGAAIVSFQPAYLHKSEGRPGFDAGSGWLPMQPSAETSPTCHAM
jgi:hypothetical protein